jgi:hypothetical protein
MCSVTINGKCCNVLGLDTFLCVWYIYYAACLLTYLQT